MIIEEGSYLQRLCRIFRPIRLDSHGRRPWDERLLLGEGDEAYEEKDSRGRGVWRGMEAGMEPGPEAHCSQAQRWAKVGE